MLLIGQAWVYRVGNALVRVENAFAWIGWAQERLLVNDDATRTAGAWYGLSRDFKEDWLTPTGEGELSVRLRSRVNGIGCEARLNGVLLTAEAFLAARWRGSRNSWAPAEAWSPAGKNSWIADAPHPPE
ncbi:MAG: hypothetical protein Q7J26_13120 [Brevundimonas sp.]|uniref:hypothetical protein n=1 Tax=Brevundimonas sp. TaxID=1871086 RepID=UPI002726B660|nr:hypothetical protein [Brevundimonas sp.]MDO9609459.1 hypothetical protein [Brevundimonas sp.]